MGMCGKRIGVNVIGESLSGRFGPVVCVFCGYVFDPTNAASKRFLVEPTGEPGLYRARCRSACTGMPFVASIR